MELSKAARIRQKFASAAGKGLVKLSVLSSFAADALETLTDGLNKTARRIAPNLKTQEEKERVFYHEASHALLCEILPGNGSVTVVNLLGGRSTGGFVGHKDQNSLELDRPKLINIIAMTLGGLVGEEIKYGKEAFGPGVLHDLRSATKDAKKMVNEFGMSELGTLAMRDSRRISFTFGGVTFILPLKINEDLELSETTKTKRDAAIKGIVDEAKEVARKSLQANWHIIEKIVQTGYKNHILTGHELRQIIAESSAPAGNQLSV